MKRILSIALLTVTLLFAAHAQAQTRDVKSKSTSATPADNGELSAGGVVIDPKAPCSTNGMLAKHGIGPMQCVEHHWIDLTTTTPPPYYTDTSVLDIKIFQVSGEQRTLVDQTLINALRFVPQAYIHRHDSGRNVIEETSLRVTMGDDDHYQLFALLTNKDEVGLVPGQSPRATVLEKSVIILLQLHKPRTIALSDKLQAVVERVN